MKHSKNVILLYSTDAWHSHSSRELIGAFSDQDKLDKYLSEMEQADELTDEDMMMLANHGQTQGRNTNYLIETEKINPEYETF
jgi:hypothetical protein|nr:MAG TPA: hypothetical protein [Caudoviricetes sp.]